MAVCTKCGSSSTSGLRYCTRCGAELPPVQGTEVFDQQGRSSRAFDPTSDLDRSRQTGSASRNPTTALPTERWDPQTSLPPTDNLNQQWVPPNPHIVPPPVVQPRRSSTGLIVALTAIVTILLLGGVGFGAWYLLTPKPSDTITSYVPPVIPTQQPSAPSNNSEPIQKPQPLPPPSQQPKPPEPPEAKATDAKADVVNTLNAWAQSVRAHDFERQMSFYAPTLDFYYLRRNVSIAEVRENRIKAFERFSRMDVELGNIKVELDDSGNRAAAEFDKAWRFEGDRPFTGAVHQLVTLGKYGNRWLITGERDLVNYRR
ncbi:MAG TPA: hypothetical protein VFC63_20090 [Blastocatellia bacterium]|nr:hypothetical protein [Blastocatellia bacterium]